MTSPSRATVDFEAFARDLQQPHLPGADAAGHATPANGSAKGDPLAELARIVGQDDPFRALLEARDGRRGGTVQTRIEPSFTDAPLVDPVVDPPEHALHRPAARQAYRGAEPSAERHETPADAFDQYLASVDRGYDEGAAYPQQHEAQHEADGEPSGEAYEGRALKRVSPRRKLVSVGAGLAVVVLSVTGALTWRGLHHGGTGGVPIIKADTAPLKIQPKTADGVEIPDQNKQIYEPKAKDGQIRIVNREEQPLDVASAARAAQGPDSSASVTPGGAQSKTQGGLSDAFGEPRRVRTVSVKPDTPVPAQAAAPREAETQTPPPALIPTMMLPDSGPPPAAQAPRARSVRQAVAIPPSAAPAMPAPTVPAPAAEATRVVAPPAPTRVKAPQRVASVAPDSVSPIEAPATTSATTMSSTAPVGGFSVQLGVRNSAGDAQAAFKQMQAKYAELAGQPALIRQAEVNGKSLYRVRVGPLGKSEATSLCAKLQGEGGQCFVAKN